MSITVGPQYVIDGPVPKPPLYRLLDGNPGVQIIDSPTDPHWQIAAQVWSYPSDVPSVWDGCSDPGTDLKLAGDATILPVFQAYTVYFPMTCTMRGIDPDDIEGWQARATAALLATESFAIEKELSRGDKLPLNPFFTDAAMQTARLAGSTAISPRIGQSYLEDAIAETARAGVIHATPGVISGFSLLDLSRERDGIFTPGGTPIVRGQGYLGASPDGTHYGPGTANRTKAWTFATGPLKILRSAIYGIPDTPAEALDRENNVYTFRAERNYLVIWDTVLQAAVLIDWSLTP